MFLTHRVEEITRQSDDTRRVIGEFILRERTHLSDYTSAAIAQETFVSKASVTRFAKSLGYEGWRGLLSECGYEVGEARRGGRPKANDFDAVIAEEVPHIAEIFHGPVIANVGGFSLQEYAENCAKLSDIDQVAILEVNISCPNVHAGGKNFGCDPHAAAEVTRAVKAVTKKPVFMKLTPNVTDIAEIARACADAGADGLCLINTLLGMRIDLKTKKPLIANRTGGLSGPAVFPVAVRMVWDVYEAVKLPIIGCGGVSSAEDVCEMMLAGASAVEIGAANLRDPYACKKIVEDLPGVCERLGVERIAALTGAAHG